MSLIGTKFDGEILIKINDGAQVIQRVTSDVLSIKNLAYRQAGYVLRGLRKHGFTLVSYNNKKNGADLLRIQSKKGIMKKHNLFNESGKKITNFLTCKR